MTPLEAVTKAIMQEIGSKLGVCECCCAKAARASLLALAETELPSIAFFKAGIVLGELHRQNPAARGGDQLAAQWKAVCLTLTSDEAQL